MGRDLNRTDVLCDNDRQLMSDFNVRSIELLGTGGPLKNFLFLFKRFFRANLEKELAKNRLVIDAAVSAFEKGKRRNDIDVNALFGMTKEIDRDFVENVSTPFFTIRIRYEDFEIIRKKRISSCIGMVFDLLGNWDRDLPFSAVVRKTYDRTGWRDVVGEQLHLYNIETKMLGNSITINGPAGKLKDLFSEKLFGIMETAAHDITDKYSSKVYDDVWRSSSRRENTP